MIAPRAIRRMNYEEWIEEWMWRMNSILRQKLKKGSMEFCYGLKLQVCACGQWMRNARKVFYNICSVDDTRKQGANETLRHERPTKMNETTPISRAGYSSGRRSAIDAADRFFCVMCGTPDNPRSTVRTVSQNVFQTQYKPDEPYKVSPGENFGSSKIAQFHCLPQLTLRNERIKN